MFGSLGKQDSSKSRENRFLGLNSRVGFGACAVQFSHRRRNTYYLLRPKQTVFLWPDETQRRCIQWNTAPSYIVSWQLTMEYVLTALFVSFANPTQEAIPVQVIPENTFELLRAQWLWQKSTGSSFSNPDQNSLLTSPSASLTRRRGGALKVANKKHFPQWIEIQSESAFLAATFSQNI